MDNKKPTINEMLGISMEKIKEMADVNSIIGDPITGADGSTIIPISRVSYGFASGGSDLPSKYDKDLFAGGTGAGITIKPEGFLVISADGNARMVTMEAPNDPVASAVNSIPAIVEKIQKIIAKKKAEKTDKISEVEISD